jgi:molybdopterin-guanine dinucleotide biosynthesis protein A
MLSIVLQAGGRSTRMGRDKASLPFLGKPLLLRLKERFQGAGSELLGICNDTTLISEPGLALFRDLIPGRGALGGLYSALYFASQPLVGIIAVDMPFASPELILELAGMLLEGNPDAAIPSSAKGIEPLHAVYRRESCLPLVKAALEDQQWRIRSWFDRAQIRILDPEQTLELGASEYTFFNLNTPEDLQSAEVIARQQGEM